MIRRTSLYIAIAAAISGWPEVAGKVIESAVTTRVDKSADGPNITRHIPQVRYAYAANGVAQEGTTIRIGLADIGYLTDAQAREHAGRYPAGSRVAVRYDPSRPATAVLESGQMGGTGKVVSGALFLIVGLAILGFAIWIGGLDTR
jgi:uncharacterized protein DUF3592